MVTKSYRVDASAVTDTKKATPLEIALGNNNEEIASIICNAIGQEVPDKIKIMQLSKTMYKDNKTEAKREFKELLESLDPELVGFFYQKFDLIIILFQGGENSCEFSWFHDNAGHPASKRCP